MNMFFAKLMSSAAAMIAVTSSAYAQNGSACCPPPKPVCCSPRFEQGFELNCDQFPAAYNAPARFDVQCGWDFFVTGSFTYWHASQNGMQIAEPSDTTNLQLSLMQKFQYKPGFKVGLGMDFEYDNWVGYTEYTWFRSKTVLSVNGSDDFFLPWSSITSNDFSSEWKLHMDILDTYISRPFYSGRYLTIQPFGGLRAAWIRQLTSLKYLAISASDSTTLVSRSHVWSVGPSAGLNAHWLLGWGFRFEGDVNGSLLYTRFKKVSVQYVLSQTYRLHDYAAICPNFGLNIGLGWGSYFDCQNYHFDLLTTYDFNVFQAQNMVASLRNYNEYEAGSLHLHGLTITAQFDF